MNKDTKFFLTKIDKESYEYDRGQNIINISDTVVTTKLFENIENIKPGDVIISASTPWYTKSFCIFIVVTEVKTENNEIIGKYIPPDNYVGEQCDFTIHQNNINKFINFDEANDLFCKGNDKKLEEMETNSSTDTDDGVNTNETNFIQDQTKAEKTNEVANTTADFAQVQTKNPTVTNKGANLSHQEIYYGAPGTGKSYKIKQYLDNNDKEADKEKRVFRTTFHPEMDYASFVGAYKPTMDEMENIVYEFVPQVFMNAYVKAWEEYSSNKQDPNPVYLIIEEINRGNCAAIFGDLFQLLDRGDDGKSQFPIVPNKDIANYLEKFDKEKFLEKISEYTKEKDKAKTACQNATKAEHYDDAKKDLKFFIKKTLENYTPNCPELVNGKLCLPPNLYIWATMNTSDQSLFLMDSAFKRRWDWEYVPINYEDSDSDFRIEIGKGYSWLDFLKAINEKIYAVTKSADKQMGNFFVKPAPGETEISSTVFINKVMFYLWNEVFKEEFETENNHFRDAKDNDKEFTFEDLFPEKNKGDKLLEGFFRYLGLEQLSSEKNNKYISLDQLSSNDIIF